MNTEERVHEALQGLYTVAAVVTILMDTEEEAVSTFMTTGCGCHHLNGTSCSKQFSTSDVHEFRASCADAELDLVIMGQLLHQPVSTTSRHMQNDHEKSYTTFSH